MQRWRGNLSVILVYAIGFVGCTDTQSARGTVSRYLQATNQGDTKAIYELLAPKTQKDLAKRASSATSRLGGHRRFKAHEMLAVGTEAPHAKLLKIETVTKSKSRATVRLSGGKDNEIETINLVRVNGQWRIQL